MNWKILPTIIVALVTIANMYSQLDTKHFPEMLGWLVVGMWFFWIAYAFYRNKDLPMLGSFSYDSGKNQPGRIMATYSMLFLYVAAIYWS